MRTKWLANILQTNCHYVLVVGSYYILDINVLLFGTIRQVDIEQVISFAILFIIELFE